MSQVDQAVTRMPPTPAPVGSEPGLDTVAYRIGTAGSFLESMRQSAAEHPALGGLHTRGEGDPATALLDAFACALDVLTFYSERAADEGFLRTADEPESVTQLAGTVGYHRGPGRASTTWLQYTLESGPGAPEAVPVPAGAKVASRPGPGEDPQTFETLTGLLARPEWNSAGASRTVPAPLTAGDRAAYLAGLVSAVRPGDHLLFTGPDGERTGRFAVRTATAVNPLPELGVTELSWDSGLPDGLDRPAVYVLRLRASLFGATAPDWRAVPQVTRDLFDPPVVYRAGRAAVLAHLPAEVLLGPDDWPSFTVVPAGAPADTVDLEGASLGVVPGSWLVLRSGRPGAAGSVLELYRVVSAEEGQRADFALSGRTTRVTLAGGHDVAAAFGSRLRTTVALARSEQLDLADAPLHEPVAGSLVVLAAPIPAPAPGRPVLVSGPRPVMAVSEAAAGLVLTTATGGTVALGPGDLLEVTGPPTAGARPSWPVRRGDLAGTVVASRAELLPHPTTPGAAVHAELAAVADPPAVPGSAVPAASSELRLAAPLAGCYDRAGVRVSLNVVRASHGETRTQVLGSGDATLPFQRFRLAEAPVAHVDGVSTLQVRVDGVAWTEVPSLLGRGPHEQVYAVWLAADGTVTLTFGDGVTGARVPSGTDNVVAAYRVGTGLAGVLPAGGLELLMTRPLGVRSVTNPLPTGLAADPDDPAAVRRLAPQRVLTLDRVVSLTDHADFARATPGIAKAVAGQRWAGERPLVEVTVAGESGQEVGPAERAALVAALVARGASPDVGVAPARLLGFDVAVRVFTDPQRVAAAVLDAVRARLLDRFGFAGRDLDQPVTASEIMAAAHTVPGVVAATVSRLRLSGPAEDAPAGAGLAGDGLRAGRPPGGRGRLPTESRAGIPAGTDVLRPVQAGPAWLLTVRPAGLAVTQADGGQP